MSVSSHLQNSVAQTQVPMSVDVLVELAKNAVNPLRCEWGTGTRAECNITLNSWTLLKKHLCALHGHATKDGYLCWLPQCNCQLHTSHLAFAEHIESAHLSRLLFSCPLSGCKVSSAKGIESLVKHYQEHHKDLDGQVLKFPVDYLAWKPFPQSRTLNQGVVDVPLPPLPSGERIGPGKILVNVGAQHSQNTLNFRAMTLGEDTPTPSQELRLSQDLEMTLSQGAHPMTWRKTKPRQLEKPEKVVMKKLNMEEDGVSSVILDDLTRFGLQGDCIGSSFLNCHDSGGNGGFRVARGRGSQRQGVMDAALKKSVDINVVFAERSCLMDLSRPQPMLMAGVEFDEDINRGPTGDNGKLGIAGTQKSILFEALMRRVDEMERAGVAVDTSLM